jgi:hypothetical protein
MDAGKAFAVPKWAEEKSKDLTNADWDYRKGLKEGKKAYREWCKVERQPADRKRQKNEKADGKASGIDHELRPILQDTPPGPEDASYRHTSLSAEEMRACKLVRCGHLLRINAMQQHSARVLKRKRRMGPRRTRTPGRRRISVSITE